MLWTYREARMRSRNIVLLLLLLGSVGAFAFRAKQNPLSDKDFTIRSDVRLVLLDVSVRNTNGGSVSGMTKDNFTIYEDGKRQKSTQFANHDIPVTVGIVVDESGSMRPKRNETIA